MDCQLALTISVCIVSVYSLLGMTARRTLGLAVARQSTLGFGPTDRGFRCAHSPDCNARSRRDSSKTISNPSVQKPAHNVELDWRRVKSLQAESERVRALLQPIFDHGDDESPIPVAQEDDPSVGIERILRKLDFDHSTLLRILLTQREWSRTQFEGFCTEKHLMPDGALEIINSASQDEFDCSLIEGDDPIEVNVELVENGRAE